MASNASFHSHTDTNSMVQPGHALAVQKLHTVRERTLSYDFNAHYHPFAAQLMRSLLTRSVRGLQQADTDPALYQELFTSSAYAPTKLVRTKPVAEIDFASHGGYAVYNWELFYHVPLTVAIHLSRNERFAEAQRWFHYIFDPTDDSDGPTPERFWRVKPFKKTDVQLIEEILINLATGADDDLRQDTIDAIGAWKDSPFRPHLVARYRPTAFMFKAVMAYVDNLVAWGDSLFRQDSGEAINEATQIYVLAANILGTRPQAVPRKGFTRPQTYASLRADLDAFGNAIREMEAEIPFDITPPASDSAAGDKLAILRGVGSALYFCIPRNDKLMGYWDTVADRLFKIRNSLNIQGIFRQLPLFDPPIDPALLARAAASGLDVSSILAGLNQPLPLVRFQLLVQRAAEIAQEVKSLGAGVVSAIEKEDGERLALLRAHHEKAILALAETVRYHQWQEAKKGREGLEKSLENAIHRYEYYEKLLGNESGAPVEVVSMDPLDVEAMKAAKFDQEEKELGADKLRPLESGLALDSSGNPSDFGLAKGALLTAHEVEELNRLDHAQSSHERASVLSDVAGGLFAVPQFDAAARPMGAGVGIHMGGLSFGHAFNVAANVVRFIGSQSTYEANLAGKLAGYQRRELEWAFQSNVVAGEINQTLKQLRAAQIREAMAEKEYLNHQEQIRNSEEIETFLSGEKLDDGYKKTSTQGLYTWMKREVRGLYNQCFQFAFDVARKAERALQHELGDSTQSFLKFGYTGGKEGLLAGEKLYLDLKRMELAYHELNHREYELTKHVSLRQLDPLALLSLRTTGSCIVTLPEGVFDLDVPGHYFRRLKTVAVTIPCVVGPYAGVNCTLTLLKSSIRKSPLVGDAGYARDGEDTERFSDHFGSLGAIVTSSAQNDSGMFETNLRDERYLPFEGSGAISQWQLELPSDLAQFDPDTIADVLIHLRYTAREGGVPLRAAALEDLRSAIAEANATGSVRLISVRHDFPTEWALFTGTPIPAGGKAALTLPMDLRHYPFWIRKVQDPAIVRAEMLVPPGQTQIEVSVGDPANAADVLVEDPSTNNWRRGSLSLAQGTPATEPFTVHLNDNTMSDLWLALTWGGEVV